MPRIYIETNQAAVAVRLFMLRQADICRLRENPVHTTAQCEITMSPEVRQNQIGVNVFKWMAMHFPQTH